MFLRYALFFAVNIAIVSMITIVLNLFGLDSRLSAAAPGMNMQGLFVFCLIYGMIGSFISLLLSKFMAKHMMGVQLLDDNHELTRRVHGFAQKAGIKTMPEVGIYQSSELNAFATGPSKNNSLVAVSTGLLERMDRDEVDGVLGHEVAHIANGDMVTMTLLQGIVNAFVMFFARVVAFIIDQALRSNNDREGGRLGGFAYFIVVMLFQFVFGIFGAMITGWFSRYREFRADAGGAALAGKEKMIAGLEKLRVAYERLEPGEQTAFSSLQISTKERVFALLSTHPPLEKRIRALKAL